MPAPGLSDATTSTTPLLACARCQRPTRPEGLCHACRGAASAEYQAWVSSRTSRDSVEHLAFGLVEEAGEVAGKFKRLARGDYAGLPPSHFSDKVLDECGDVLFYLIALAQRNGVFLEDLMDRTRAKLRARIDAGTIRGEGDAR